MNKIKRHLQTPVWIWILNKRHMISWWKPYKPVHLDVEASRWPFGGRTSQFCRSVVGWGAKWFELLLNIIDFRWSKLLTTCCQNRSSYSRTYATASNTRPAFRSWMWVGYSKYVDLGCDINFYLIIKVFLCKIIEDTNILENSWYWMARILKNMAVMNHFPTINLLICSYSKQLVKSEQFCIDHRVYYHHVWLYFGILKPWLDSLSKKFDKLQCNSDMFR